MIARRSSASSAGAVLVLAGGAIHLELNLDDYGNEDILEAFALNAPASALVAAYLVLRDDVVGPLTGIDFREVDWNPSPEAVRATSSPRS